MAISLRELIRSPEGNITRDEFLRGASVIGAITVFFSGILWLFINPLNLQMGWMTVAIAPILGMVTFVGACSVIYFWYCLFAKRLRGLERSVMVLNAWLVSILIGGIAYLMAYQDRTLNLGFEGIWARLDFVGLVFALLATIIFLGLLVVGSRR